jgi:hypothetical protein
MQNYITHYAHYRSSNINEDFLGLKRELLDYCFLLDYYFLPLKIHGVFSDGSQTTAWRG